MARRATRRAGAVVRVGTAERELLDADRIDDEGCVGARRMGMVKREEEVRVALDWHEDHLDAAHAVGHAQLVVDLLELISGAVDHLAHNERGVGIGALGLYRRSLAAGHRVPLVADTIC